LTPSFFAHPQGQELLLLESAEIRRTMDAKPDVSLGDALEELKTRVACCRGASPGEHALLPLQTSIPCPQDMYRNFYSNFKTYVHGS
jgi:hypothetical protein